MANSDMLVRIKANTDNYNAGIAKASRTLNQFKQENLTMGGIINQSTKSLVAAAAQYASFAAVIGTVASGFAEATSKGIAMAREAEGVSKAFERLNQPGLLDNLREATHNTVNDLELMKQAVKFDNFNLSMDQMGTFLAFAQQQAKDTGQDVNYLVDSIVTGLGRKSLPILDNLGLSATDIKNRMKETGDMTTAVAQIIEERMKKAGDYVETASDRAAQAQTRLENAMMELGNTFGPITESSDSLWNSIKVGAINALSYVGNLINYLHEAGRISKTIGNMNGGGMMERFGDNLRNSKDPSALYSRQLAAINRSINAAEAKLQQAEKGGMGSIQIYRERVQALKEVKKQYEDLYKTISSPAKNPLIPSDDDNKKTKKGGGKTTPEYIPLEGSIDAQTKKVQELQKAWRAAADDDSRRRIKEEIDEQQYALDLMTGKIKQRPKMEAVDVGVGIAPSSVTDPFAKMKDIPFAKMKDDLPAVISPLQQLEDHLKELIKLQEEFGGMSESAWQIYQKEIENTKGQIDNFKNGGNDVTKGGKEAADSWKAAASAISSVGGALQSIEDPAGQIAGLVAQAIATVAQAYAQALSTDWSTKSNIWAFIGAAAASTASMITTISAIHSATGYAQGGIVKGNSYSGDNVPALVDGSQMVGLNAGEVVLTRAMQSNLAGQLQNGGNRIQVVGRLSGEQLFLCAERWSKRTGKGEFVTWR